MVHFPNRLDCSTLSAGATFPTSVPLHLLSHQASPIESTDAPSWKLAAAAADAKQATDIRVLDLRPVTSFTDFFVICSVKNQRQGQAVCDEVETQLKAVGERPVSIEGYDAAEWILMDYGDVLIHILSESARAYYQLERLWRHAETVSL